MVENCSIFLEGENHIGILKMNEHDYVSIGEWNYTKSYWHYLHFVQINQASIKIISRIILYKVLNYEKNDFFFHYHACAAMRNDLSCNI